MGKTATPQKREKSITPVNIMRRMEPPKRTRSRTQEFDMHVHSIYSSDGQATPKDIVKRAKKMGLGGIAIVDHNSLKGGEEAKQYCKDIIIIPGMEVSSSGGHIVALGIDETIQRDLSPEETVELIQNHGGIAIAPHPYRFWSGLGEEYTMRAGFQVVEVLNARSNKRHNQKAETIAKKIGAGKTGGSDAHDLQHVGDAYTIFPSPPTTADDALQMITKKQTKVGGNSRSPTDTVHYVKKSVGEWLGRGMKRM